LTKPKNEWTVKNIIKAFKSDADILLHRPIKGSLLPKHHVSFKRLKDGKLVVHIPAAWKDEWKQWASPTKTVWGPRGIEYKIIKKNPATRREILQKIGMATGGFVPLILTGATTEFSPIPIPALYGTAIAGEFAGEKLDTYLQKHEAAFRKLKRKERQIIKKTEKEIGTRVKKYIDVT